MTIVFYDNSCSMCVGVTGWLSKIDHKKQFTLEPYQHSETLKSYPQINPEDCKQQIHIINESGKVMRGQTPCSKSGDKQTIGAAYYRMSFVFHPLSGWQDHSTDS